jgi:hypothetical protein
VIVGFRMNWLLGPGAGIRTLGGVLILQGHGGTGEPTR